MFTMPPKKNNTKKNGSKPQQQQQQQQQRPRQKPQPQKMGCPYPVLSAHNPRDVPCGTPSGKAASMQTETRFTITSGAQSQLLAFSPAGKGPLIGAYINDAVTPSVVPYNTTQYSLTANCLNGGPVSGRAMKLTLDLRNTSPAAAVGGGTVYVLETDARVSAGNTFGAMTQAEVQTLMTSIRSAPGVRVLTGADLARGRTYSCRVADFKDYEDFGVWEYNVQSAGVFSQLVLDTSNMVGNAQPRPMTTLWVLIDNYAGTATYPANTYDFRLLAKHYLRYSPDSLPYTMQKEIPLASPQVVARIYKGTDFQSALMAV